MTEFINISITFELNNSGLPCKKNGIHVLYTNLDWKVGYIFNNSSVHFQVPRNTTEFLFKVYNVEKDSWYYLNNYPKDPKDGLNNIFKITRLKGYYFTETQLKSSFVSKQFESIQKFTLKQEIEKTENLLRTLRIRLLELK